MAMQAMDGSGVTEDRDAEFARKSLALSMTGWPAAIVGEQCLRPKLAIGMLIKAPAIAALRTFVLYHARIGIARFHFFFDDTSDIAGVRTDDPSWNDAGAALLADARSWCPGVEVLIHRCTLEWWSETERTSQIWDQWGATLWSDLIARQVLALETAAASSLAAGVQWLIHIDADEALWLCNDQPDQTGAATRFFASVPEQIDQLVFLNHEAAPESDAVDDWFTEVTLFKKNPACGGQTPFVAYSNGKSAVRLADGVVPSGSHRFTSLDCAPRLLTRWVTPCDEEAALAVGEECIRVAQNNTMPPCLLHYVNCGFEEWRRKYQKMGAPEIPSTFTEFHTQSRDLIVAADATSDAQVEQQLRDAYCAAMVLSEGCIVDGLPKGDLFRSNAVAQTSK